MCFFLMPYAKARPYEIQPARSLFLDGEIALMMAARRALEEKPEYQTLMTERIHFMVERMQGNPLPIAESYPNECWMFEHVVVIGASAFQDDDFLSALAATLDFAAFPARKNGALKYSASNQVGDAALLYAAVQGPLWEKIKTGRNR